MRTFTTAEIQKKRAEAQAIEATLHVGKGGVTDATVQELRGQLKRRKLVKVRLLGAATEGGAGDAEVAERLAAETGSLLVERRGHTAVFWKA